MLCPEGHHEKSEAKSVYLNTETQGRAENIEDYLPCTVNIAYIVHEDKNCNEYKMVYLGSVLTDVVSFFLFLEVISNQGSNKQTNSQ